MGISALPGPRFSFGVTRTSTGGVQEYNEQRGADLSDCGHAMMDPRSAYTYRPGSGVTRKTWGWWESVGAVDAPTLGNFTLVTIAATQQPVTGTALTLSTQSSGCVTAGVTLTPASNPNTTVSVLAIDSTYATAPSGLTFGQSGTETLWDPRQAVSRGITFEKSSTTVDDSAATYTIKGYDIYGYAMVETITGTSSTGSTSYVSQKSFKYIESIVPGGTIGTTSIRVHPNNTFGFPLAVHGGQQVEIWISSLGSSMLYKATSQTSLFTFASTVTTQTATTPDIRGTWANVSLTTSAGTNSIAMTVTPRSQDIQNMSATYSSTGNWLVVGDPQYSS